MPFAMPMWPPISMTAPSKPVAMQTPVAAPIAVPVRRRWMIVDDALRREVDESEYRAALASCERVDVAHYRHEDVITHLCYRTKS